MSPKELAPTEDQGVIFGILDAAANATLDQTSIYAAQVNRAFHERTGDRVHLPDDPPDLGFRRHGGETLGRAQAHHLPDPAGGAAANCRPFPASGCFRSRRRRCRRRPVSGGVRDRLHSRTGPDPAVRPTDPAQGDAKRHVRLPAPDRRQDRPAAVRDRHRPRQGGRPGPEPAAGRRRPRLDGRRQLRQPLQHRRPQLQGDPADSAHRPAQSGPAGEHLCHRARTTGWSR